MKLYQGQRFNRLVATTFIERKGGHEYWDFTCDCGNIKRSTASNVYAGRTHSCGCKKKENTTTHGLSSHELYGVWENIIQRCANPNNTFYYNYGGRGITVCARWREFDKFLADVGERPSPELTIERSNNEGNYEPGNVRWATRSEQQQNTRRESNQQARQELLDSI